MKWKNGLKDPTLPDLDLRGLLLVALAISWLAGIVINAWLLLPSLLPLTIGMCALLFTVGSWRQPSRRLGGLLLLFLCLGAWRYATVAPANDPHAIRSLIGSASLQIQGEIADDPRLESGSTLLTVNAQRVSLDQGQNWQAADGQIQVQVFGATFDDPYAPRYGDTLQLSGRLSTPPSYATPELQASMDFPRLTVVSRNGNPLLVFLYQARSTLANLLLRTLPQPEAALMIAIFLSLRTPALKPLLQYFNETGTAHLIAPSGFKVTLLSGLVSGSTYWLVPEKHPQQRRLLPAERRQGNWRRWLRTLLLLFCIAMYTVLSGGGPAALRAGSMGILLVLAPRLGRFYNVYTAMALTVLFMSIADPFVLWDTGFLLSFIGTLGILLFTPFFQYSLRFLNRLPLGFYIAETVAVTLAAQIATLPILALNFKLISFIALVANLASVPLLGLLLTLGTLICLSGLLAFPLALLSGWLAWPLLWYVIKVIPWCASLPDAYLQVDNLSPLVVWTYYVLLICFAAFLFSRWQFALTHQPRQQSLFSARTKLLLQSLLATATLLSTCLLALASPPVEHVTVTLLSVGDPTQGQALFLRTPRGQTALIDEGADSATLAQTLDTLLPMWQRSLSLVILADNSANNLTGLQDIVTRYQVQQVIDAGMLHPSLAYARWRSTLATRHLTYTQVRQGALIELDRQTSFQVLWPPAQLHKSSDETHDNALVLRLLAPNAHLLLLNSAAQSKYALQMLSENLAPASLQAETVQVSSELRKAWPAELTNVLTLAKPSFLLLTNTPARKHKSTTELTATPAIAPLPGGPWQVLHNEQAGSLELQSASGGWSVHFSG